MSDSLEQQTNITVNQFALGPFGLEVAHHQHAVVAASLLVIPHNTIQRGPEGPLTGAIDDYLTNYLQGNQPSELLPLSLSGTAFQQQVWQSLCAIPAGQVTTYGKLAADLNTAAQPIGGACKANPVAFFVPCHRVVAATGLGGYMGKNKHGNELQCKAWLLAHEAGMTQ